MNLLGISGSAAGFRGNSIVLCFKTTMLPHKSEDEIDTSLANYISIPSFFKCLSKK